MSKYTITINCEDEFEMEAHAKAVKNRLKLECVYDEVFRPVIKYSENKELVESYEQVWKKLSEYLED